MHELLRASVEEWFSAVKPLLSGEFGITPPVILRVELFEQYLRSWSPVVGVFGSLKVGKSTLLNTLVDRPELLKTHEREATSSITALRIQPGRRDVQGTDERVRIHFARGCTFELVGDLGLAADDLEEALQLLEHPNPDVHVESAVLHWGSEDVAARGQDLSSILQPLRQLRDEWNAYLASRAAAPMLPRQAQLNVRFRPRKALEFPLDEAHREHIHAFMAVTSSSIHRTVARVVVQLTGKGAISRDFVLVDLPGRASRNSWRNQLTALIARHALDQRWVIKWSTEDDASSTEFRRAVAEAPRQPWLPHLYVVSQVDRALAGFAFDQQHILPPDVDGAQLFRRWCRETWIRYLHRGVARGEYAQLETVAQRCVFVSALENRSPELALSRERRVKNPVHSGLDALVLATAHDQAFRYEGDFIAARARLALELTHLLRTEAATILSSLEKTQDDDHAQRLARAEEYRLESWQALRRMQEALEQCEASASEKLEYIEEASQDSLKGWAETGCELFISDQQGRLKQRLQRQQRALGAHRARLLEPGDLKVLRVLTGAKDLTLPEVDTSKVTDALSGLGTKLVDAINIFRLLSSKASLQERDRRKASHAARRVLKGAIDELLEGARTVLEEQEAQERELLDVVEERASFLRRAAAEARVDHGARQRKAARLRAHMMELERRSAAFEPLCRNAEHRQQVLHQEAAAVAARVAAPTTRVRVRGTLAGVTWETSATSLDRRQEIFFCELPVHRSRAKASTQAGTSNRLTKLVLEVSGGTSPLRLRALAQQARTTALLRADTTPGREAEFPVWGSRPCLIIDLPRLCVSVVPYQTAHRWMTYVGEMRSAVEWLKAPPAPAGAQGGASILDRLRRGAARPDAVTKGSAHPQQAVSAQPEVPAHTKASPQKATAPNAPTCTKVSRPANGPKRRRPRRIRPTAR